MVDDDLDVRAPSPLARLSAWLGPPRDYRLTRWLILRLLGVVYLFAFLGIAMQGLPLLGEHGLTPIGTYVDRLRADGVSFLDNPSIFMWGASDGAIMAWAYTGLALSIAVVVGYANLPMLVAMWLIYGSYERVGQLWFGFGWEIQLLETTLLAAFLVHPWNPCPLKAPAPPRLAIELMRWLAFRIMIGAGLIKLRGSECWDDLTCLDAHFETQPIPNPLSAWFHHLPSALHQAGVGLNHFVEVVLPWFVFGPRVMRLVAGVAMAGFQIILIISGNLSFLNWLTLVPILACFDDELLRRLVPARGRAWIDRRITGAPEPRDVKQLAIAFGVTLGVIVLWGPVFGRFSALTQVILAVHVAAVAIAFAIHRPAYVVSPGRKLDGHQLAVACFAALVAIKSVAVIDNLFFEDKQAMNRRYDRLALVNTYGAFGSVTMERYELVIEGTRDPDAATATWHAYELPCKPGPLDRRPCILGPYHRRLDWLIWFAAMSDRPGDAWIVHFVYKLLDGDRSVRELLAVDPFDGARPTFVRIRRFRYHLQPLSADTWWTRDDEQLWLQPVAIDDASMHEVLARYRWPSPSLGP